MRVAGQWLPGLPCLAGSLAKPVLCRLTPAGFAWQVLKGPANAMWIDNLACCLPLAWWSIQHHYKAVPGLISLLDITHTLIILTHLHTPVYINSHTQTWKANTFTCIQTQTQTHTPHSFTHTQAHSFTCSNTLMHTCAHTDTNTLSHTDIDTHALNFLRSARAAVTVVRGFDDWGPNNWQENAYSAFHVLSPFTDHVVQLKQVVSNLLKLYRHSHSNS